MREFVILAVPDGGARPHISACSVRKYPLPFGAEVITRVVESDLDMMMSWVKRRAKNGWSINKIKAACE